MAPNQSLILSKNPTGLPIPGVDLTVKTEELDLDAELEDGSVLLQTVYLSYDPFMRGRMKPIGTKSYVSGYPLGATLQNAGILKVLKSSNSSFKPGDLVLGNCAFSTYQIIPSSRLNISPYAGGFVLLDNPSDLDPKLFLGALGMSGLTAYSSLYEIGKPKKGETIFISAASGAVGQIVGQLAKREGLRVLGSVGSQEKLDYITKELGFDAGFNYKVEGVKEGLDRILEKTGGGGLNIYYDNVGGEHLDVAIITMENFGRIIQCGSISQSSLDPSTVYRLGNLPQVVARRLTLRGFIVSDPDFGPKYRNEQLEKLGKWIKDGEVKVLMHITEGMENAAEGFVGMLEGKNYGKAILKLADI